MSNTSWENVPQAIDNIDGKLRELSSDHYDLVEAVDRHMVAHREWRNELESGHRIKMESIDAKTTSAMHRIDALQESVTRLNGAIDPAQVSANLQGLRGEIYSAIRDLDESSKKRVEEAVESLERLILFRLDGLKNNQESLRGEVATIRQMQVDQGQSIQKMHEEWARFKRVMESRV